MDALYMVLTMFVTLLVNPLLWVTLLAVVYVSYSRVKRERALFRSRIYSSKVEWGHFMWPSVLLAVAISLTTGLGGVTVTPEWLITLSLFYTVVVLTFHPHMMQIGVPLGLLFVLAFVDRFVSFGALETWVNRIAEVDFSVYALLFGLLTIAESILLRWDGPKQPSPTLILSKRGQFVGGHVVKRIWFVPFFIMVPSSLSFTGEWVPVLVPAPIGVSLLATGSLADDLLKKMSLYRGLIGVLALAGGIAAYWFDVPYVGYVFVLCLVLHRLTHPLVKRLNRRRNTLFLNGNRGVVIIATRPASPGSQLGLLPGESVYKVNGKLVRDALDFYGALQAHKPYIKLEVVNLNGDVRFVQRALYETDPHELGILFVGEPARQRVNIRKMS